VLADQSLPLRARLVFVLSVLSLLAAPTDVLAQDYLLPNDPGKAELIGACESCHGVMTIVHAGKRSPRQWDDIMREMARQGMAISDDQRKAIVRYLNVHFGQAMDFVRSPEPRARGPGVDLALEAAETAEKACEANGQEVTTLVVDSAGTTIVLLTGNGISPITQAVAATKVATVLKFKEPSGAVMKRLSADPALVAEIKKDPEIGEVLPGGLPIMVNGDEIIGAIAVSGALGPADTDESCARAGLERIASRLRRWPVGLKQP
jgi:uncharacterized protein GlcG (DUF336 family)